MSLRASLVNLLPAWVLTLCGAAVTLRMADAVPGLLLGTSRGVLSHASVEEAARRVGAPVFVPAYFPESLGWPPAGIRSSRGAVALELRGRRDGVELLLVEGPAHAPLPDSLLARGTVFHSVRFDLGGQPATLAQVQLSPGETWQDLSFEADGRLIVFRFRGPTEVFLKMAESLSAHHPVRGPA